MNFPDKIIQILLPLLFLLMTFTSLSPGSKSPSSGLVEASPSPRIRHDKYYLGQHIPSSRCPKGYVKGVGGDCYQIVRRRRRSVPLCPSGMILSPDGGNCLPRRRTRTRRYIGRQIPNVCPTGQVPGRDKECYQRVRRSVNSSSNYAPILKNAQNVKCPNGEIPAISNGQCYTLSSLKITISNINS